jgi:hypothetical protein
MTVKQRQRNNFWDWLDDIKEKCNNNRANNKSSITNDAVNADVPLAASALISAKAASDGDFGLDSKMNVAVGAAAADRDGAAEVIPLLIIEIGCGESIHGLRMESELLLSNHPESGIPGSRLVRIDPGLESIPIIPAVVSPARSKRRHAEEQKHAIGIGAAVSDTTDKVECNSTLSADPESVVHTGVQPKRPVCNRVIGIRETALRAIDRLFSDL